MRRSASEAKNDFDIFRALAQRLGYEQAFNEDRDMITAQHRNIGLDPGATMTPLWMDSALAQFRRLLEAELAAESKARVAA